MRRILFVDDEQQVLDGLRDLLRKQRRQWDMVFALGASAALEQMQTGAPFDVVVTDMRMPKMDGAEFLRKVKELNPGAARIVLSGQAEQELVLRALPVSHQYLSKPLQAEALRQVIERACELRGLLPDPELQKLVGNLDNLPSVPASYWELMRSLSKPNVGLAEVCRIVERDPALHAKVLQVANSAFFGLSQRVTSITSAVSYLGLELIKAMAVVNHVFSAAMTVPPIPGFSLEELQQNALLVAELAKTLIADPKQGNDAFTAGLLRDVGQMVLALGLRERFEQALSESEQSDRPLHEVERERLGASHAEVGAFLLGSWGLPTAVVLAVSHHHAPAHGRSSADPVTRAVQLAEALVEELSSEGANPARRRAQALEAFGTPDELARWREIAARTLANKLAGDSGTGTRALPRTSP